MTLSPEPDPIPPAPVSFRQLAYEPVAYQQVLRTPSARWWRGLLAVVSFVVAYVLVSALFQGAAIGIDVARGRVAADDLLAGRVTLTPLLLLGVNLTNAAGIPIAMLLQRAFFGVRGQWLHSVTGVFRWRLVARTAVIVLPVWALYLALGFLARDAAAGSPLTGESIAFLVIILLSTPLQSAGEEYGARGLVMRAAGSWSARPGTSLALGTVVSAGLFTVAHGAGDPWLIAFYFLFGVSLALVVWRTGGLEAAVVIHAANNLVMFVAAIAAGQDLSNTLDRSAGSGGPAVLVPAAVLVIVTVAVCTWAYRAGVTRLAPSGPEPAAIGP